MDAADLVNALLETTLATSMAIALVLLLRRPLRATFGARVAYTAWVLVPIALLAVLLPAPTQQTAIAVWVPGNAVSLAAVPALGAASAPDLRPLLLVAWLLGLVLTLLVFVQRQRRFHASLGRLRVHGHGMQAESRAGLPAVMGWWRPEVVLPADFDSRYSVDQRALVVAHEQAHIARGDLHVNAFVAALRCVFWFNPLLHFVAQRFRHDQELACDASVIARRPDARRAYGEALLQAQFTARAAPLGCHFGFGHPLKERVTMLAKPVPSSMRWLLGSGLVIALALGTGLAAWAAQPGASVPVAATDAKQLVNLRMRLDVDGKTVSTPSVLNYSGRPFSVSDGRFQLEMTATVRGDKSIALAGSVYDGDKLVTHLKGVLEDGKPTTYPFLLRSADADEVAVALTVDASTASDRIAMPMRGTASVPAMVPNVDARAALMPPVYPEDALKQGQGGTVMLLVAIDAHGNVIKADVESPLPQDNFAKAALAAVGKWKFAPATKDGEAVPSRIRVPVEFKPSGK